jgi:hypothetical protein
MISSVRRPLVCAAGLTVASRLRSRREILPPVFAAGRPRSCGATGKTKASRHSSLRRTRRGYLGFIAVVLRTFQWLSG